MIYITETSTNYNDVKKELEKNAKAEGFGLLNSYDFKRILHEKGFPIEKDITVYELCNPAGAYQALTEIAAISAYLPCRISIYEENGVTKLATIGLDEIIKAVEADDAFKSYMLMLFENLKRVMHSWDDRTAKVNA